MSKEKVKKDLGEYYWGKTAKNYNWARVSDIRQKESLERESRIIKDYLKNEWEGENNRILDIACGTGIMFENYGDRKIFGLDISKDMLKIAEEKYPLAKLTIGDAESLPFKDNSFQIVISSRFICHIPNYKKVISEIVRVTSPGGVIILDFFNKHSSAYPTTKLRLFFGKLRYFNLFSFADIRKIANENNLEIVELKSKVFIPLKGIPLFIYPLFKKFNDRFTDLLPKYSNPMYIKFRKRV